MLRQVGLVGAGRERADVVGKDRAVPVLNRRQSTAAAARKQVQERARHCLGVNGVGSVGALVPHQAAAHHGPRPPQSRDPPRLRWRRRDAQRDGLASPGAEKGPRLNQPVVLNRPYQRLRRANAAELLPFRDGRVIVAARTAAGPPHKTECVALADSLHPEGPARRQVPPPEENPHVPSSLKVPE